MPSPSKRSDAVLASGGEPLLAARLGPGRVDAKQEGEVRGAPGDRDLVQPLDQLDAEAAGGSLVGDGRVDEAVADTSAAGVERRPDDARAELRPGGAEQQQLGARVELELGVLQQVANPLAGLRAAGLAEQERVGAERLASSAAWVVFPERSIPSSVTNTPALPTSRDLLRAALGARRLRRRLRGAGGRCRSGDAPSASPSSLGAGAASASPPSCASCARFSLLALLAHLDHRRAVVVQAELPGTAAEALDREPRHLAADRAALLEPPEVVAAAGERAADRARVRRLGVVAVPALAAVHPLAALELDDPQPVRASRPRACGRPPRRPCRGRGTCPRPSRPRSAWRGPRFFSSSVGGGPWSISRLIRRTSSLEVLPAAIWSMSSSSSAVISGVAIRGT